MWRLHMLREANVNPVISYKNLRRLIGILGMLLPLICFLSALIFAGYSLQRSISFYYYTNVRDIFVGILIAVGVFLLSYNGYEKIDCIVSSITGIAGIGIALFPCLIMKGSDVDVGIFQLRPQLSDIIHLSCAGLFFTLLAINSIFLFTLSDSSKHKSKNKKIRNAIYVTCGIIILACMLSLLLLRFILDPVTIQNLHLVFIMETIMLEAFGFSWLIKGETLFTD